MNERLKTFYDQVGLDFENFQRVTVTKGDIEKFAELIIRECITVVDHDDGATHVRELLLEHFGVEE
jgi:predicted flavoprotein YhiN